MDWISEVHATWLGTESARVLQAVEWAALMGDLDIDHVMRVRMLSGDAAWCRLTKSGDKATCVAIAPWGSVWDIDRVPRGEFFSRQWPADWRTKTRDGLYPAPEPLPCVFEVGAPCVGLANETRHVILATVASLGAAGELVEVQTTLDGPELEIATMPHRKWWPINPKYDVGARKLLASAAQPLVFGNYVFLCMRCANAEMHPMQRAKLKRDAAKAAASQDAGNQA